MAVCAESHDDPSGEREMETHAYFELGPGTPLEPAAVLARCIESGARAILLDENALPAEFFDLRTGLAGELLQRLTTYRIRLACVVPDASVHPTHFQEFVREANRGVQFRFVTTREAAIEWLEST